MEEAVKKEFEKRAAQFGTASVVDEVVEKASPTPPAVEEQGEGGGESILPEQAASITGDDKGSEWSLPNFEEEAHQSDTSFASFEVDKKRSGIFAKNGLLFKTLIVVIAAGITWAIIANYNTLQEINPFLDSDAPEPVKKAEPVKLPTTVNQPAINVAPPAVQDASEDKTALPEAMPETAPDVSDKPHDINTQGQAKLLSLTFEINGRKETVSNGEILKVKRGDKIRIVSADAGVTPAKDIVVNLLGFTGNKNKNTGEDRGYLINTNKDMWKKYSTNGKGSEYPIIVKYNGEKIGGAILKIAD